MTLIPRCDHACRFFNVQEILTDGSNVPVVMLNLILELGVTITVRVVLTRHISTLQQRASKDYPSITEVFIPLAKLMFFLLHLCILILINAFTIMLSRYINTIQPAQDVQISFRILFALTIIVYFYLFLFALRLEPKGKWGKGPADL